VFNAACMNDSTSGLEGLDVDDDEEDDDDDEEDDDDDEDDDALVATCIVRRIREVSCFRPSRVTGRPACSCIRVQIDSFPLMMPLMCVSSGCSVLV
jgi:hypothetical protein